MFTQFRLNLLLGALSLLGQKQFLLVVGLIVCSRSLGSLRLSKVKVDIVIVVRRTISLVEGVGGERLRVVCAVLPVPPFCIAVELDEFLLIHLTSRLHSQIVLKLENGLLLRRWRTAIHG